MAKERSDLKPLVGQSLAVIALLWARTVKSPNPAFRDADVPLASTFMLCTKSRKEAYVEPVIENGAYRFAVRLGEPKTAALVENGTKAVPDDDRVDAVTLFLHEMAHALGFNGRFIQEHDAPPDQWRPPTEEWISTYDESVVRDGRNYFFVGASAVEENDGSKVPLS